MESQELFNLVVSICGVLGGWLLKMINDRITDLQKKDDSIEQRVNEMQTEYVRREDFKDAVNDIKLILHRIDAKLDTKADKA